MGAPRLTSGPAFLQQAFNGLADHVDSVTPVGPGVTDSATGKGRYIAGTAATAKAAQPADFSLYDASSGHGSGVWIGVRFGIVQPYRGTVAPWPSEFTATGHKYEFSASSGMGAVWISVTNDISGDYYTVSGIAINNGSTVPDSSDTVGILTIGTYDITDGKITKLAGWGTAGVGNQVYNYCGYAHFFYAA